MIDEIKKGIEILKTGGLVAYPTDTVYGLGACADNIQAVKRIYLVKKRPLNMPLPLLLADVSWINKFTSRIPSIALPLIDRFMPGALTLVLPKANSVSDIISGGKQTIALRVPAHPIAVALIEGTGSPVVGTSANISGSPSALTAQEVEKQLGNSINYIVDGGKCPGGIESTIIDVTGEIPVILRQGAITQEEIEKVCRVLISREES
jgi:L-threonylcarbamoyladenylate synthase